MITNETKTAGNARRYYVKPKTGSLTASFRGENGFEDAGQFNSVSGNLVYVTIVKDPGTPKSKNTKGYDAYDALQILLVDDATKEEYVIRSDVKRTFAWLLSSRLAGVNAGDLVKLTTRPGDKEEVTLPTLYVFNATTEEWVRVEAEQFPEDRDEKIALGIQRVKEHSCYKDFEESTNA